MYYCNFAGQSMESEEETTLDPLSEKESYEKVIDGNQRYVINVFVSFTKFVKKMSYTNKTLKPLNCSHIKHSFGGRQRQNCLIISMLLK